MYVHKLIYCAKCSEHKAPYKRHAIFCAACWKVIEDKMAEPLTAGKSRIFSVQEARLD